MPGKLDAMVLVCEAMNQYKKGTLYDGYLFIPMNRVGYKATTKAMRAVESVPHDTLIEAMENYYRYWYSEEAKIFGRENKTFTENEWREAYDYLKADYKDRYTK